VIGEITTNDVAAAGGAACRRQQTWLYRPRYLTLAGRDALRADRQTDRQTDILSAHCNTSEHKVECTSSRRDILYCVLNKRYTTQSTTIIY